MLLTYGICTYIYPYIEAIHVGKYTISFISHWVLYIPRPSKEVKFQATGLFLVVKGPLNHQKQTWGLIIYLCTDYSIELFS